MKIANLKFIPLTVLTAIILGGCSINRQWNNNTSDPGVPSNPFIPPSVDPSAPGGDEDFDENLRVLEEENFVIRDGMSAIKSGDYELVFELNEDKYGVYFYDSVNGRKTYESKEPLAVAVKPKSSSVLDNETATHAKDKYLNITKKDYGYLLSGIVTSENGSVFSIDDAYYVGEPGGFAIKRKISVIEQSPIDDGFQSSVEFNICSSLTEGEELDNMKFTYFLPASLYKDNSYIKPGGIGKDLENLEYLLVKETRTGLPLAMIRHTASSEALTISHFDLNVDGGEIYGGGPHNTVNNSISYGSIGYGFKDKYSVEFHWPSVEGPTSYDNGGEACRYHTVIVGTTDIYSVALNPNHLATHNDATVNAYEVAYEYESPEVVSTDELDMDDFYEDNMHLLRSEYRDNFESGYGGLPYSIDIHTNKKSEGYSSQMGFVGQQIPLGYNFIRNGLRNNNSDDVNKGEKMIDFWASKINTGDYFPVVWWVPENNSNWLDINGNPYPAFLRCMVDGLEGLIDAYRIEKAYGRNKPNWYNAIVKVASNLVDKQESDGSFRRAYMQDGSICTDTSVESYAGESKLNTPVAIRMLGRVYELTGDLKYKTAAVKAAEYSYTELYEGLGKYIGGTADNPNYLDKEAAVYAMHGFLAAYQLTKNESAEQKDKFLKAAQHATVCSLSWVYMFDFKIPATSDDLQFNMFQNGGTMGFSMVLNGNRHGSDNYAGFMTFNVFNTYVLTGNTFYRHAANVLEKATKYSTNWDERMPFKYKALCPEATGISDFQLSGGAARYRWLAWCGAANIVSLADMTETYGFMNISEITTNIGDLRQTYNYYGCGGGELSA